MDNLVLFRFHNHVDICIERLQLLHKHNPNVPIYGIGEPIENIDLLYENGLVHNYVIETEADRWKWKNGDLVLRKWYNNVGKEIEFNRVYVIEWDMLLTDSLENIYSGVSDSAVVIPRAEPLDETQRSWLTGRYNQIDYLEQVAQNQLGASRKDDVCVGLFPGVSLPRSFLDLYSSLHVPEVGTDEMRLSVFAHHSDFKITTPNFPDDKSLFNTKNNPVNQEVIKNVQDETVFHPVVESIDDPI